MARVAAAACLLALAGAGGASVVAARRASMHEAGVVMHALWADVLAGRPTAALLGRARWVAAWAGHLPDLFPPGSDGGATNALPGVWSDPAGFAARAKALRVAARAMVAAAEAGDRPGFAAAFRATDYACGQCHRDFRHR
jgi:cytochrome c556